MSSNDPSSNDRPEPVPRPGNAPVPPPAAPPGSLPPQGMPPQGMPPQGMPPQGVPSQGFPGSQQGVAGQQPAYGQIPIGTPQLGQSHQPPYQQPVNDQGYQQPYQVQQQPPVAAPYASQGDSTGGVIPYKNPKALISYYLGIAAMLPVLGIPAAPAALILGIMGLLARRKNPIIKGSIHAWIGILGGFFGLLLQTCIVIGLIGVIFADTGNNLGQFEMPPE